MSALRLPAAVRRIARRWPEPAARAASRILPARVLCYVDTRADVIALTFDDGPHPDTTPGLLDVLKAHGAKATFFLIGERAQANEEIVARIAAEGHELANHLMRDEPSIRLPGPKFRDELAKVGTLLTRHGDVRWFRPGSGWFSPRMLRAAAEQNLGCVLGTVVAQHVGTAADQRIARRILRQIRPGTIVVLHEGTAERQGVVAATDQILDELDRLGLDAVTVSALVRSRR